MFEKIKCEINSKYPWLSWCRLMPYIVFIILLLMVLSSCASIDRKDDAIRIKKNKEQDYSKRIDKDGNSIKRDGNTLRGTVYKIIKVTSPNSCPVSDTTTYSSSYSVLFLDSKAGKESEIERIPLDDIDLVGQKENFKSKVQNEYDNINWFENFNDPLDPRTIREVPVDSFFVSNCPETEDCNCNPLSIALELNCPNCDYKNYFVELRGGYAVYDDINSSGIPIGRDSYMGEVAFGYRTGNTGIGISISSGVPIYNSQTGEDIWRPTLMLHTKQQFDKVLCMIPFVYGQIGIAADAQSLNIFNFNSCDDLEICLPKLNFPISYGMGIGLDIPLPFCLFDLSFDFGYKSLAIGETYNTMFYEGATGSRRVDMFLFRLGVTLGY